MRAGRGYSSSMVTSAIQSADPTTGKPPRPRRWIPLTLRMYVMMLGVLGVGSVLWFGFRSYRQFSMIERLERIDLVEGRPQKPGFVGLAPNGPGWLRSQIGDHL